MDAVKIVAIALIVAGGLGLAYGSFSYTKETHNVDLGPLHMEVAEKQQVNIPTWAGLGAILVGGLLLVIRRKS
jgi:LPXTG-motif cell wall-anchored protein